MILRGSAREKNRGDSRLGFPHFPHGRAQRLLPGVSAYARRAAVSTGEAGPHSPYARLPFPSIPEAPRRTSPHRSAIHIARYSCKE